MYKLMFHHATWVQHIRALVVCMEQSIRVLVCLGILLTIFAPAQPAYAQGTGPEDPVGGAAGTLVDILASIGSLFIRIAYMLMFLVFAVGSVRSGLGAQLAQQFGASGRLAGEVINLATGVVIFVIALMALPLVNYIATELAQRLLLGGGWDFEIYIPELLPGQ